MGTRNLTFVYLDGDYKMAQYGQWDGYPEGLGVDLLKFLKNNNIEKLKNNIRKLGTYTAEDIEIINNGIKEKRKNDNKYIWQEEYPELSRDTDGAILLDDIMEDNVKSVFLDINFAANSLLCEWAYVIDLDNNAFEMYEGFNKEHLEEFDRFYFLEDMRKNEYHPIKKIIDFKLDNLPEEQEFLDKIYKIIKEKYGD